MDNLSSKQKILNILKQNQNRYVSGQEMADSLYITRAAVWKGIKSLEKEGYVIEAVTNRGYKLQKSYQLNKESILARLTENKEISIIHDHIFFYDTVDSTNDVARNLALEKEDMEAFVIAAKQTKGRGRRGRSFFSPEGTGIYLSYVFRPNCSIDKATAMTCIAACAICKTIEELTDIEPKIKWVNDIYVNDKKVAGILTEAVTSIEDGELTYVIIGIGINVIEPIEGFPKEISKTAGALFKEEVSEEFINIFCARLICNLKKYLEKGDRDAMLHIYREHSFLIGNYVKITAFNGEEQGSKSYARVLSIDEDFHLCVEYEDGMKDTLSTGEVSVVKY